jgi:hypothetical protein
MPYTLDQLEFVGIHLQVTIPPELLEKKRAAGGSTEPPKPETPKPDLAAQAKVSEKRKALLEAVSKLVDPPFAGTEALAGLRSERDAANGALSGESPTPEQFLAAENAIAAFGEKVELEKARVGEKRKNLLAEVAKLGDPAFAAAEALSPMQSDRDTATAALSAEFPTSEQFQAAENAIAAFSAKLELEKKRVSEKRKGLADAVSKLTDPDFAGTEALAGLRSERETATGALSAEFPTAEQFQAAERAIAAFAEKVEGEKKRVAEKRKALLEEVAKLTDPDYAGTEALGGLKSQREAAAGALTAELPALDQITAAERAIAAFAEKVELEKQRVAGKRTELVGQVNGLDDPDFADTQALGELKTQREAAVGALSAELPTPAQIVAAELAIATFAKNVEEAKQRAVERSNKLKETLATLTDPAGADVEEKKATKKERDKAKGVLDGEAPTPAEFKEVEKALTRLKELIKQSKKMGALATKNPGAATEARKAFKGFRDAILDEDVTPEMIADAKQEVKNTQQEIADACAEWNRLNEAPVGETDDERIAREEEQEQAAESWRAADARNANAVAREKALDAHEKAVLGEKLLTEATNHGPLSGDTGRPFKDATATKLVQAFAKNPRLAQAAVKTATTARHPDVVAAGLDKVVDQVGTNFQATDRRAFSDPEYSGQYGENLLRMGGELGGTFFDDLPAYVESGNQFATEPLGPIPATYGELTQKRGLAMAKSMLQPDGSIDPASADAKTTFGHMMFHPDSVEFQTPPMNASIIKTMEFLADPTSRLAASNVLKATVAPTNPGAQTLVRAAVGKAGTDPVDAKDTRATVLAAMLKPLQQGGVGSCFSTAPTRLLRETKPLEVMKAYSDIASKGKYKPPFGPEVPAVTNLPPNEDPLHRSFEYTLATAASRVADSDESKDFAGNMGRGVEQFRAIVGGNASEWVTKKANLKLGIKAAFNFVYDPMSKITDSSDGSSSQGRYVVRRISNGKEIRTKEDFVEEMADVAIKTLSIDPSSGKATEVKNLVKQDAFINAVCPDKYKPWAQPSGGRAIAVSKVLRSGAMRVNALVPGAPTSPKPPEGQRTTAVLTSFLDGFSGRTDQMVTVDTVGRHSFNALPNHPSLAALKGSNPSDTAAKVRTNLVDVGLTLKNTDLSAERAGWLFDEEMNKAIDGETDDALKEELKKGAKAKRPAAAMKPADLTRAVKEASAGYHTMVAENRANAWKLEEETAGRPVTPDKLAEKKTKLKDDFDSDAETAAKSLLIRDMGAPEFVIADTNWGGACDHTLFVISPDPTTGDPVLWKKKEPPGSLTPAGREWVDDQWIHIS